MATKLHRGGPYIMGETLGEGTSGLVRMAFHRQNGQKVAIKIISKTTLKAEPTFSKKTAREIALMKLLDHPNILKLIDVYETHAFLFLVLELVSGGEVFTQ